MTYRHLLLASLACAACVTGKSVGELDDDGDSGDSGSIDSSASSTPATSNGDDATDPTAGDTGVPGLCPLEPFECSSDGFCSGDSCLSPLSQWDENGCPRASCGGDGTCPDGQVCLRLGDWGSCAASSWGCELYEGECVCGGTADCSEDVSHCIPEEIAPPPVALCIPPDPGAAFAIAPALGDASGTAECTVISLAPLQLDCTGDFMGVHTINLASAEPPALAVGQIVTFEHYAQAEIEWLDTWLRITSTEDLTTPVVAVNASALLPAGAPADFWPTNVEVAVGDIGCLEFFCGEEPGSFTGQAIRVGQGPDTIDYAAGESGPVPGKFGGEIDIVTVHEAREGACGATLGDQPGWFSLVIVQTPA